MSGQSKATRNQNAQSGKNGRNVSRYRNVSQDKQSNNARSVPRTNDAFSMERSEWFLSAKGRLENKLISTPMYISLVALEVQLRKIIMAKSRISSLMNLPGAKDIFCCMEKVDNVFRSVPLYEYNGCPKMFQDTHGLLSAITHLFSQEFVIEGKLDDRKYIPRECRDNLPYLFTECKIPKKVGNDNIWIPLIEYNQVNDKIHVKSLVSNSWTFIDKVYRIDDNSDNVTLGDAEFEQILYRVYGLFKTVYDLFKHHECKFDIDNAADWLFGCVIWHIEELQLLMKDYLDTYFAIVDAVFKSQIHNAQASPPENSEKKSPVSVPNKTVQGSAWNNGPSNILVSKSPVTVESEAVVTAETDADELSAPDSVKSAPASVKKEQVRYNNITLTKQPNESIQITPHDKPKAENKPKSIERIVAIAWADGKITVCKTKIDKKKGKDLKSLKYSSLKHHLFHEYSEQNKMMTYQIYCRPDVDKEKLSETHGLSLIAVQKGDTIRIVYVQNKEKSPTDPLAKATKQTIPYFCQEDESVYELWSFPTD